MDPLMATSAAPWGQAQSRFGIVYLLSNNNKIHILCAPMDYMGIPRNKLLSYWLINLPYEIWLLSEPALFKKGKDPFHTH